MVSQTIWIVDTQNRSQSLAESITSPQVEVISLQATNQLAQSISSRSNGAVIANIHENEDFETLEHLSKISLTFPEIPLVLLLPEPLHASIDWGPRVFNLIKPVSPESILKRLSFLDEHSYPTRGILQRGYLLALLDHCLLQKKHVRIMIRYAGLHTSELLIQNGKLISLYIDNSLKNDKVLFPFALDGAEFAMEHLEEPVDPAGLEPRFSIGEDEYRRFRLELHPFLSLMQQFPPMSDILKIDDIRLMKVLNSLPEQVHSVIRHFNGKNDLFQIFLESDLRPLETAQRIGYLYFSDVFQTSHAAVSSMFSDNPAEQGAVGAPMRDRSSSELAGWLLNPVAAARELEEKIKKNLKSRKSGDGQFRPHRKTQPGLGGLLRPVLEEDSEDDASKSSWGGVNVRLLRESQQMLLKMSDADEPSVPGLTEHTIEFGDDVDDENAEASGVIDVAAVENPAIGSPGSPKIILESAPMLSGESVIPPELSPAEAFHDEPTMPLEQFDEGTIEETGSEPARTSPSGDGISQDSLLELLSLRSEDHAGGIPLREEGSGRHQTRELPAAMLPDSAPPIDNDKTPEPGLNVTPVPNFEDEPNSARTPIPSISHEDPTPLPEGGKSLLAAQVDAEPAALVRDRKPQKEPVQTFQHPVTTGSSKWKYFIVVAIIAGVGIWYVFHSRSEGEMTAPAAPDAPTTNNAQANNHVTDGMTGPAMEPVMAMEAPPADMPPENPTTDATPAVADMPVENPTVDATPVTPDAGMQPETAAALPAEALAKATKLYDDYIRREIRASRIELEKLAV
ncbi:MAG: hypothetical protein CVU65_15575 [Deltaproteobacteria bacterium HGW-Deltaproteobacteria-22]|nr:MAG: hypothetical protein CVU65_15575 [Deltaproteobacteria bacterium HGW-Deltaproteobacteria-22]